MDKPSEQPQPLEAHQSRSRAAGFWREVPCGHPPDPVAIWSDGHLACHCGRILDDETPITRVDPYDIVSCQKCGCHVGVPIERPKELPATPDRVPTVGP